MASLTVRSCMHSGGWVSCDVRGVLVRTTRSWRGEVLQGRGFGLLDGSLGLVAAACARLGLMLLQSGIGNVPALVDAGARAGVLRSVISR